MSSSADGVGTPSQIRPLSRPILRQATLILPKTGERVKRSVTFRHPIGFDGTNGDAETDETHDERSPLLGPRASEQRSFNAGRDFLERGWKVLGAGWEQGRSFVNSRTGKGVFKCSVAYFLGSLATLVPFVAAILGQQQGKHLVATITVYFHPARSRGSMFEAILCAILAFAYAVFICFTSMGVSILFGRKLDLLILGHVIVLIVFCGGGLGFVGWVKQRLEDPLVNIACSLTSLAIITVLTKEGAVQASHFSDDKIIQVMLIIIMGVSMTTAVSFLISPVSARKDLRENMVQVTSSFAEMLAIITRSFLSGSEEELLQKRFLHTSTENRTVLASLTRNLKEAKYEHYFMGTEKEYSLEAKLLKCMQRLSQNIGGLRSAATTQFLLLAQPIKGGASPMSSNLSPSQTSSFIPAATSLLKDRHVLATINEAPKAQERDQPEISSTNEDASDDSHHLPSVNTPADIFSRFIEHLGPSMKSLAFTLKQILDELPYGTNSDYRILVNAHFGSSLDEAIKLYNRAREEALAMLYRAKDLNKERPLEVEADFEEVAASCGHFSFSLQDFAYETQVYLDILDDMKKEIEERPNGRSWNWLKIWRYGQRNPHHQPYEDPEGNNWEDRVDSKMPSLDTKGAATLLREKNEHSSSYGYRLWKALRVLRREDTKFAIKVGFGAALYALPSFIPSSRPFYRHWRGEWGLLSYMLVCSMTIGASNTTGFARFFGTCIGAVCAIVAWTASLGNPFALAVFGWFMSYCTAYIIVARGKGPMGRFIMLTYNLTALYAYSLSVTDPDNDNDEGGIDPIITEIALHRVVAVLSGCLWGLIITRFIWPISARQKFKDGLSLLWLRMGLIWRRDPLAAFLDDESPNAYMDLREEFELQHFLTRLEKLRSSAISEIDLRGPFPDAIYGKILKSTSRMLDAFHAMNVVILKDPKASDGEAEILRYTAGERAELCARISHLFQDLASSMKLELPLNEALPSTDHARDRLLAKIFRFRRDSEVPSEQRDEDFTLLYAYALVTGQLSKEIHDVCREIEALFGILNEELLKLE